VEGIGMVSNELSVRVLFLFLTEID